MCVCVLALAAEKKERGTGRERERLGAAKREAHAAVLYDWLGEKYTAFMFFFPAFSNRTRARFLLIGFVRMKKRKKKKKKKETEKKEEGIKEHEKTLSLSLTHSRYPL